jgi:hypothetical protein
MAAPFIAHDGEKDGVRAEVHVQKGNGVIDKIERAGEGEGRNAYIHIKSSIASVKKPVKSWLDKSDPLFAKVVEAHTSGREIEYRIEAQRKPGVDRSIPIAELRPNMEVASEKTTVIFAALDGEPSLEAVTNPAEDPAPGDRARAADPQARDDAGADRAGRRDRGAEAAAPALVFDVTKALAGLATARSTGMPQGVIDAAAALALMAGATAKQVNEAGFTAQRGSNRTEIRRAHAKEGKPFEAVNSDGRTNLGSYAVSAVDECRRFAFGLRRDAEQAAFDAYNADVAAGVVEGEALTAPRKPEPHHVLSLGKMLLEIADRVQVGAYGGGRVDRMAKSHSRARSLVFDTIRHRHPVPFGAESPDAQREWVDTVVAECVETFQALAEIAMMSTGEDEGDAQSTGEAQQRNTGERAPSAAQQRLAAEPQQAGGDATSAGRARPLVEGQPGFTAPEQEVIRRFGALAQAAGFQPVPDSPIKAFLQVKFGVPLARQINGTDLDGMVTYFEGQGNGDLAKAGEAFRAYVEKEIAATPQAA